MDEANSIREILIKTESYLKHVKSHAKESPLFSRQFEKYMLHGQREDSKIENSKAYLTIRCNEIEDIIKFNCCYTCSMVYSLVSLLCWASC